MVYKRFVFSVGIRVGLLLANLVLLAFIFARTDLFFSQVILFLLLIFQTYDLVRCTTQTNRELARFLSALQYGEYSVHFSNHRNDPSFERLYQAFGQVLTDYQRVRTEKQSQQQYLELILTHLNAGIMILSDKEEVVFLNVAAKDTLQIPHVEHWRQVKTLQPQLVAQIDALIDGGRTLVELTTRHDRKLLSVQVTAVTVLGKPLRCVWQWF